MRLASTNQLLGIPHKVREKNVRFQNPNWREADQLPIYKHDRGVKLVSTEKQSDQNWT